MQTLLEKAKSHSKKKESKVSEQEIELALAWVAGEITYIQIITALGFKPTEMSKLYKFLAEALKSHLQKK